MGAGSECIYARSRSQRSSSDSVESEAERQFERKVPSRPWGPFVTASVEWHFRAGVCLRETVASHEAGGEGVNA